MNLTFQDSTSPSIEHILFFHDHSITILILITILTSYLILSILYSNTFNNFLGEGQEIETIWTILPALMLIFIALPSLNTLYLIEDTNKPDMTININGHQWYWSYEYSSFNQNEQENFIENSNMLRLLNTSNLLELPVSTSIRCLISSADVIHSWSMPSMGVNVDALPGRLNQLFIFPNRVGLYTGQCSEICGSNHSFIPILTRISSSNQFLNTIMNS